MRAGVQLHFGRVRFGLTENTATKTCPDCAEEVRAAARKCRFCGFIFPQSQEAQPPSASPEAIERNPWQFLGYRVRHGLWRLFKEPKSWRRLFMEFPRRREVLAVSALVVVIIATIVYGIGSSLDTESSTQSALSPTPTATAHVGETVTVLQTRPCGSTEEALDELVKWAVRGDNAEFNHTMRATRSFALDAGMKVKILDTGFGKRKIRVVTNNAGEAYLKDEQGAFPADTRIGRECWVNFEALQNR